MEINTTSKAATGATARKEGEKEPDNGCTQPSQPSQPSLPSLPHQNPQPCQPLSSDSGVNSNQSSSLLSVAHPTAASAIGTAVAATTTKKTKTKAPGNSAWEKRKRENRERISKEVGHDVDTDEEQAYEDARWERWNAEFEAKYAAEEARRNALTPQEREKEDLALEVKSFEESITPHVHFFQSSTECFLDYYPLFILQYAPSSPNGATCRSASCTDRINPGEYRFLVTCRPWGTGEKPFLVVYFYILKWQP